MSKLSVHRTFPGNATGYGEFLRIPYERGNPVYGVYQLNANTKADVIKYSPTTKLIFRKQSDIWPRVPQDLFIGNPITSCDNWMLNLRESGANLIEYWQMNPSDFYDPLNEPIPQTVTEAQWLNTWTLRALEIASRYNIKLALFSFSVGRPEYNLWQYLLPALREGKKLGAILSLHQYGVNYPLITRNPDGSLTDNTIHNSLRHRKVYELLPDDCKLDVWLTESACGNGFGVPLSGQAFINDAVEFDKEIMKDRYVKVANLFQLGGNESNLQSVLTLLTDYISITPTLEPPPEDEIPVTLPYVVTAYLGPQSATIDNMKFIQGEAYNTKSTVCQSADDARHLVRSGKEGSKAIIYDPQSWPGGVSGISNFFAGLNIEFRYLTPINQNFRIKSPILDIPFRVTDVMNSPRPYGKHEGIDLDSYNDLTNTAVPVYACADGVVEKVASADPSYQGYGNYIIVRHDFYGQIYKTWYCHLSQISVTVGTQVKAGIKIGVSGQSGSPTPPIHLHLNLQKIGGGLSGYIVPDVVDPLAYMDIPKNFKSGVGMGDQSILTSPQKTALNISKVKAIKLLTLPDPANNTFLVSQVKDLFIVSRLFFSVNESFRFTPQEFVNFCRNGLDSQYKAGVRYFEVHNEPNLKQEGYGWNWLGGKEFGDWLVGVLNILKPLYPEAQFGYPGLSPQPNTEQFFKDSKFAADQCSWVGCHSYWNGEGTTGWGMESIDGGMYWKRYLGLTNKPLYLTEFSNNNPITPYTDKGKQYYRYFNLLKSEPLEAAFCFALSWSGDVNKEAWVVGNTITQIPYEVGA